MGSNKSNHSSLTMKRMWITSKMKPSSDRRTPIYLPPGHSVIPVNQNCFKRRTEKEHQCSFFMSFLAVNPFPTGHHNRGKSYFIVPKIRRTGLIDKLLIKASDAQVQLFNQRSSKSLTESFKKSIYSQETLLSHRSHNTIRRCMK